MIHAGHRVVDLLESRWEDRRLLIVGDVMLDKYIWGTVQRISPEAPVPVVRTSNSAHCPGGAANVAMNVVGLGASATLVGFVGADEDAGTLTAELTAAGVSTSFVTVREFPTTSKLRILSGHQQMLRVDIEQTGSRPGSAYETLIQQAREALPSCSALVLSDYSKGTLTDSVCITLIHAARALGIPVLVDPKSPTFEKYRNATTICPNLNELGLAVGESGHDVEKLLDLGQQCVRRYGIDFLTVTLGDKGIAVLRNGERSLAPALAKQVFDVSGAGDTVIATLAICLASGLEIETAVDVANVAAGIVVSKIGTVPIKRDELIAVLSSDSASSSCERIVSRQTLCNLVAEWRSEGKRIVFTNGCFDVLHVGHVHLLERARQQGDKLIVAINSDSSVAELKKRHGLIVGEQERARILAALSVVDAVVIFNESTPLELIQAVRPDVLVKGGDYSEHEVIGSAEVHRWGGTTCLVPLLERFSTSGIVAKVASQAGV